MSSRPTIPKIKRKPPPVVDIDDLESGPDNAKENTRYPTPDPSDPFAPLWVLRTRNSNNSLKQALAIPPDASQAHRRAKSTPPSAISFPGTDNFIAAAENNVDLDPPANSKWHQRLLSTKRVVKASTPIPALESLDSSYVHIASPLPLSSFPTPAQLAHAASLPLIAPSGLRIPFSSLFTSPHPTLIIFLRHFWCPHSQDYVASLSRHLPFLNSSVHIVLISNGAPAFIPKYLSLFGLEECEMYTDPTCAAYRALGLSTISDSKTAVDRDHRAPAANGRSGGGGVGGMAKVVLRALKGGLPVWERGGNTDQLGGEFVFSPGQEVSCAYAHRMRSSKDHAPIQHVLAAAGVDISSVKRPGSANKGTGIAGSLRIKGRSSNSQLNTNAKQSSSKRSNSTSAIRLLKVPSSHSEPPVSTSASASSCAASVMSVSTTATTVTLKRNRLRKPGRNASLGAYPALQAESAVELGMWTVDEHGHHVQRNSGWKVNENGQRIGQGFGVDGMVDDEFRLNAPSTINLCSEETITPSRKRLRPQISTIMPTAPGPSHSQTTPRGARSHGRASLDWSPRSGATIDGSPRGYGYGEYSRHGRYASASAVALVGGSGTGYSPSAEGAYTYTYTYTQPPTPTSISGSGSPLPTPGLTASSPCSGSTDPFEYGFNKPAWHLPPPPLSSSSSRFSASSVTVASPTTYSFPPTPSSPPTGYPRPFPSSTWHARSRSRYDEEETGARYGLDYGCRSGYGLGVEMGKGVYTSTPRKTNPAHEPLDNVNTLAEALEPTNGYNYDFGYPATRARVNHVGGGDEKENEMDWEWENPEKEKEKKRERRGGFLGYYVPTHGKHAGSPRSVRAVSGGVVELANEGQDRFRPGELHYRRQ